MPIITEEPILLPPTQRAPPALPLSVPRGRTSGYTLKRRLLDAAAIPLNACFGPSEAEAFGILMYHRVAQAVPDHPFPTWNVTPRRFEAQLTGLLARGWQAWPLTQILRWRERRLPIPRKTFVVTFDDGYANNLTQALPILTDLRVPATVFVATAYLNSRQPFPSDNWSSAGLPGVPSETWRPLTTDECHRLAASGLVELGAHTHTHADFRGRPAEFAADLSENLTILRKEFSVEQPAFAFPYGMKETGFASPDLAQAAREAGVTCCLTTDPNIVRASDSPFDWGRFAAHEHDTPATLVAKLGGWQSVLRKLAKAAFIRSRPLTSDL
jgi:peptidoglycan/xylan/chitin deacetylase (PgdA/CDA1 family)